MHDVSHVIDKNLLLAAHLGGRTTDREFPISVPASEAVAETRRQLGLSHDARFVVLNPGTAWDSKCWDAARFGAVALGLREAHGLRFGRHLGTPRSGSGRHRRRGFRGSRDTCAADRNR